MHWLAVRREQNVAGGNGESALPPKQPMMSATNLVAIGKEPSLDTFPKSNRKKTLRCMLMAYLRIGRWPCHKYKKSVFSWTESVTF